jgi:hypothetical protein
MKNNYSDQIAVISMIDAHDYDNLTGTSLMTIDGKTVIIDDFIEIADGLKICCLIYDGGQESYAVIPDTGLTFRSIVWKAEKVVFPAFVSAE